MNQMVTDGAHFLKLYNIKDDISWCERKLTDTLKQFPRFIDRCDKGFDELSKRLAKMVTDYGTDDEQVNGMIQQVENEKNDFLRRKAELMVDKDADKVISGMKSALKSGLTAATPGRCVLFFLSLSLFSALKSLLRSLELIKLLNI